MCGEPEPPIRTRACVRALQLQDPPNRLPTRLLDTNTSSGHRLQHQTGSLRAYRSRTSTPSSSSPSLHPSLPSPSFPPTSISSPPPFSSPRLVPFSSLPLGPPLPFAPSRVSSRTPTRHDGDMRDHQTALTAEVTHPSTRRCLPMDSWKTDWDFLEAIHRDLSSPFSSCGEQSGRVFHAGLLSRFGDFDFSYCGG